MYRRSRITFIRYEYDHSKMQKAVALKKLIEMKVDLVEREGDRYIDIRCREEDENIVTQAIGRFRTRLRDY